METLTNKNNKTMKTPNEQRTALNSYLTKTANHVFINESGDYQIIKLKSDNELLILTGKPGFVKTRIIDLNRHFEWYKENSENVMSHMLFLNKGLKAVKGAKKIKKVFETEYVQS